MEDQTMIEKMHDHIISELGQNTRTDTIFVLTAILLNLIILAVNSSFVVNSRDQTPFLILMFIFVGLLIVINAVAIIGLTRGKQTRSKLLNGLMSMYQDQNVDKYYDATLVGNYNTRYNLFILVVVCTGLIAIVVPFVVR